MKRIVSWPGKIKLGVSDALVGQIDLLAYCSKFLDIGPGIIRRTTGSTIPDDS